MLQNRGRRAGTGTGSPRGESRFRRQYGGHSGPSWEDAL